MGRIPAAPVIPANPPSFPRTRESRVRQSTPIPYHTFEPPCQRTRTIRTTTLDSRVRGNDEEGHAGIQRR